MAMKSTGIVRKVDELGRVVIPIELRRTLQIEQKDAPGDLRRRRADHFEEVSAGVHLLRERRPGPQLQGKEHLRRLSQRDEAGFIRRPVGEPMNRTAEGHPALAR